MPPDLCAPRRPRHLAGPVRPPTPKGHHPRDLLRHRDNAASPIAATRLKRSSPSRRSRSATAGHGPTRPTRTAACSSSAPMPRPRTASPRRSGSWASSAPRASTTRPPSRSIPTNRIAERNIDRLKTLLVAAGEKTVPAQDGSKAAGPDLRRGDRQDRLRLPHGPAGPREARPGQPRRRGRAHARRATASSRISNGMRIGVVEPRVAARLLKLIADGNKYLAGVTSLGARTSGSSSARSTRTRATTARSASRPPPSPPTSARTRRARSSARTRSSRRTSRTTSRTRRSRTSTASCRRRTRPTRRSSRRPTSSTRSSSRPSAPAAALALRASAASSLPRPAEDGVHGSAAVVRPGEPHRRHREDERFRGAPVGGVDEPDEPLRLGR